MALELWQRCAKLVSLVCSPAFWWHFWRLRTGVISSRTVDFAQLKRLILETSQAADFAKSFPSLRLMLERAYALGSPNFTKWFNALDFSK